MTHLRYDERGHVSHGVKAHLLSGTVRVVISVKVCCFGLLGTIAARWRPWCPFSSKRTSSRDLLNPKFFSSQEPLSSFGTKVFFTPKAPNKTVKARRISRIMWNKLMRALNGNIVYFERRTPILIHICGLNPFISLTVCVFSDVLCMERIPCGFTPRAEEQVSSSKLREGNLRPSMGQSVERWPPCEAGRETAGSQCGEDGPSPTLLTLPNTYVMTCQAATNTVKLTGAALNVDIAPFQLTKDASQLGKSPDFGVEETSVSGNLH